MSTLIPDVVLISPFLAEATSKNELKSRENLALGYLLAALNSAGIMVQDINAELEQLDADDVVMRIKDPGSGLQFQRPLGL